jgi:hypothetical protein
MADTEEGLFSLPPNAVELPMFPLPPVRVEQEGFRIVTTNLMCIPLLFNVYI